MDNTYLDSSSNNIINENNNFVLNIDILNNVFTNQFDNTLIDLKYMLSNNYFHLQNGIF